MNLTIRQADSSDAELISVLAITTFYEAYLETDDPHELASYSFKTYNVEQIQSELEDENSAFYFAEIAGKPFGFAKLRENSRPECLKDENTCELHRIYILERVWRKGVGRSLIDHCLSVARQKGYESMWLGTWEENIRSHKFYKKLGFKKVGDYTFEYESEMITNFVYRIET